MAEPSFRRQTSLGRHHSGRNYRAITRHDKLLSVRTGGTEMPTSAKEMLEAARAVVPTITAQDAAELVKTKGAVVVDVRDAAEVAGSGKVQGALAISRGLLEFRADPDMPTYEKALQKDKPVILYCGSGGRAALAGKTLRDMGYTDVRNAGGFKDLVAGGWTVEKA
jgi:rhodanese-related sulfurtransferase